jgi:small conductance mechanosensitive channel
MEQSATNAADQVVSLITEYGLDIIGALVILFVGWIAAKWAYSIVSKALSKTEKIDQMLRGFFASLAKYLVLIFTVLMVLSQFGVQTASLIAVLGAAGLAIGLALQGTLSNVAAGVMILIFRPFKIGDYVEVAGHAGTIKAVTLFITELSTPDNVQIIVPNGQIWGSAVKNYSFHDTRRVDLGLGISYEDDIDKAVTAIDATINADDRVLKDPATMVAVSELADSSVNFTIRVWCNAGDYWPLKFDLTRSLKEKMDAESISIPYPQQTVHMIQQSGGAKAGR